ncbi:MAG: hypothetical protein JWQ95_2477 [Sphaerisporangium sp.]|nr:hypothetical protein [Sphaerisporangium sp.]
MRGPGPSSSGTPRDATPPPGTQGPSRFAVATRALAHPQDPGEYLTLGVIARRLGVDGRTVTQYRELIDQRAEWEQLGQRRRYRIGDVIEVVLNSRQGRGVGLTPETDRRRTRTRD